jgi:hypothetical protein
MTQHARIAEAPLIGAECCGVCKFFRVHPNGAKCHRPPPTAKLIVGQDARGAPALIGTIADWPPTKAEMWCGEFKRKLVEA